MNRPLLVSLKRQFLYVLLSLLSQGCQECEKKGYVTTTVTKKILLSYDFNSTGTSTSTAKLLRETIYELFKSDDKELFLERVDVTGVTLSGEIDKQKNTANDIVISTTVSQKDISSKVTPLIEVSRVIKTSETGLGTGSVGGITFNNALNSLNALGLGLFRDFCSKAVGKYTILFPLETVTTAVVPANQRFVGTIYINITASVTYRKCTEVIFVTLEDACN